MMTIKAIETSYKGYRFRSRLEARWAVFFDALKLGWTYEPEGFNLGEDGYYLPDFWIQEWKTFVEIKPCDQVGALVKPTALAWNKTGRSVLLITGSPWPGEHKIEWFTPPEGLWIATEFVSCRRCDGICLLKVEQGDPMGFANIGEHTCDDHDKYPSEGSLLAAYQAARSARFEHGETP